MSFIISVFRREMRILDIEEAAALTIPDASTRNSNTKMRFASARASDEDIVALIGGKDA